MKAPLQFIILSILFVATLCLFKENCQMECLIDLKKNPNKYLVYISKNYQLSYKRQFIQYCQKHYTQRTCLYFPIPTFPHFDPNFVLDDLQEYFIIIKKVGSELYKFVLQTKNHYITPQNIKIFVEQTDDDKWLQYYSAKQFDNLDQSAAHCQFIYNHDFSQTNFFPYVLYTYNVVLGFRSISTQNYQMPYSITLSQFCNFASIFKNSQIVRFGYLGSMREYIHFEDYQKRGLYPTIQLLYKDNFYPIFPKQPCLNVLTQQKDVFFKLIQKIFELSRENGERYLSLGQLMSFYYYTLMRSIGYQGPPAFTNLNIPQSFKQVEIYYPSDEQFREFRNRWMVQDQNSKSQNKTHSIWP